MKNGNTRTKTNTSGHGNGIFAKHGVGAEQVVEELERAGLLTREQLDVAARLAGLRNQLLAPVQAHTPEPEDRESATGKRVVRRKPTLTPAQAASRKLQGKYIGLLVQLPQSRRGKYRKIAKTQGREVAVKQMEKAVSKSA